MNTALKAHRSGELEANEAAGTLYRYRIGRRCTRKILIAGARLLLMGGNFIRNGYLTVIMVLTAGMFSVLLVVGVVNAITDARAHQDSPGDGAPSSAVRKP